MAEEKISVGLELDDSKFKNSIQKAVVLLDKFKENAEDELEIDVDSAAFKSAFSSLTTEAIKNIKKITDEIAKIEDKKVELDLAMEPINKQIIDIQRRIKDGLLPKSDFAVTDTLPTLEKQLEPYNIKFEAADIKEGKLLDQLNEIFNTLEKISNLDVDIGGTGVEVSLPKLREVLQTDEATDDLEEVEEAVENVGRSVARIKDHTNIISRLVTRIGQSVSRQIYTTVASMLNPINIFRKTFSYLTETIAPRLGATFKNIGNNLTEYFANSDIFKGLIHDALWLIYLLQEIFNAVGALFGWKQLDLFKTSIKTGKQLQKMQAKMLAGFDEINNIGQDSQAISDATPMGVGELFSSEEMKKAQEIAAKIAEIIEKIVKNWKEWLKWIAVAVAAFLIIKGIIGILSGTNPFDAISKGFGSMLDGLGKAAEIIAILGGLALVINSVSGLITAISESSMSLQDVFAYLSTILILIASAFLIFAGAIISIDVKTIAAIVAILLSLSVVLESVAHTMKVLGDLGSGLNDVVEAFTTILAGLIVFLSVLVGLGYILGSDPLVLLGFLGAMIGLVITMETMAHVMPILLNALGEFISKVGPVIATILATILSLVVDLITALGSNLPPIIKSVGSMFTSIFNGVAKVISTVGQVIVDIMNTAGNLVDKVLNAILNFITRLGPAIETFVDSCIRAVTKLINFMVSGMEYLINTTIIKGVNDFAKGLNKLIPGETFDLKTITKVKFDRFVPSYDVGTNYVPNDQLAMIHKGEAIIPKKFNDREFFGSDDDAETNELLRQVIEAVDRIEINPYTTVKDVGEASVNYINKRSKSIGRSLI